MNLKTKNIFCYNAFASIMRIATIVHIVIVMCSGHVNAQVTIDTNAIKKAILQEQASINTVGLEFSPFYYRDYIGFCFAPRDGKSDDEINEKYFDLAYSASDANGNLVKRADFSGLLNSEFHEGPATFNAIKGILYFTRSWYDSKKGTHKDTIVNKIYQSAANGGFSKVSSLSINIDNYHTCHPTLSQDGNTMIFSSNRPGSAKMDLYITKLENNTWSEPQNLGQDVNSSDNETFPFLYKDSILFYSIDRVSGSGGLDIYCTVMHDSSWSKPIALPYPINSSFDDFGFILSDKGDSGFMTTNRPGGSGKDDIYRLSFSQNIFGVDEALVKRNIRINMIDKFSLAGIAHAEIKLIALGDQNSIEMDQFDLDLISEDYQGDFMVKLKPKNDDDQLKYQSNGEGYAEITIFKNKKYLLICKAKGYDLNGTIIDLDNQDNELNIVMNRLEPEEEKKVEVPPTTIYIPTQKNQMVIFNNVYYDYNSDQLQAGSMPELDALAQVMIFERPGMKVQLSAHTDARGNTLYNQELSQRRAINAKHYLINKGINSGRIIALGFGESRIRNQCTDGVPCSDEDHQFNRRTELLVLEE